MEGGHQGILRKLTVASPYFPHLDLTSKLTQPPTPTLAQPTQKLELREGFTKQNQRNIIGLEIMKKAEIIIALTTHSKPVSNSALVKWV